MNKSEADHFRKKYQEMRKKGKKCPDCAARAERIKIKLQNAGQRLTKPKQK